MRKKKLMLKTLKKTMCWQRWDKKVCWECRKGLCRQQYIEKESRCHYLPLVLKNASGIESATRNRRAFHINIEIICLFYEVEIKRRQHVALTQNIGEVAARINHMIFKTYLDSPHLKVVSSQEGGFPAVGGLSQSLWSVFSFSYK